MKNKMFLIFIFVLVGNNSFNQAYATVNYTQSVQQTQENQVNRFWDWYQQLNERDRIAANTFIKNFLLKENNLSENLNSFSSNKSHALALSSFIQEAERSPSMKEILICAAYEGGSGCAPNSP